MFTISIVIPAYNEGKRIGATLLDYLTFFQDKNAEIIVVLNGCTDHTQQVVIEYQKKFPETLRMINLKAALGKGGAVYAGFKQAQGKIIGFVDADRATEAVEFQKLISNLGVADGVIASRWLKGSLVINRSFLRKISSKVFVLIVKLIFKMPFSDTQCGAKIFRRDALLKILPELKETGMAFDVELLYQAFLRGYKIKEVATVWKDQPGSPMLGSSGRVLVNGIKMIKKLLKIKKYGQESNLR